MESEISTYAMKFTSKLIRNQGTWYLHIPKDLASISALAEGMVAEVQINRIYRRPPREPEKR
jgi:hypothetical protein